MNFKTNLVSQVGYHWDHSVLDLMVLWNLLGKHSTASHDDFVNLPLESFYTGSFYGFLRLTFGTIPYRIS